MIVIKRSLINHNRIIIFTYLMGYLSIKKDKMRLLRKIMADNNNMKIGRDAKRARSSKIMNKEGRKNKEVS